MQPPDPAIFKMASQASAALRSLEEFDKEEIRPVVESVLPKATERDTCFLGTYYRATANVGTSLTFNNRMHFQALGMLARTNIELAMDMKLLNVIDHAVEKMLAFPRSEKLRTATKVVEFANKSGTTPKELPEMQEFIAQHEKKILELREKLWGTPKPSDHWSAKKISERAHLLKSPFDELYEIKYRHLSWHIHAGLTAVLGVEPNEFTKMCGDSLTIAADCFREVLVSMIDEYEIEKKDPQIKEKLLLAREVPFMSDEEKAAMVKALFG